MPNLRTEYNHSDDDNIAQIINLPQLTKKKKKHFKNFTKTRRPTIL